jgi:hypothetical protein
MHFGRNSAQGAAINAREIVSLAHGRHEAIGRIAAEPLGLGPPVVRVTRIGPRDDLETMDDRLGEQGADCVNLLVAHALDLLDDVRPIDLIVDALAAGRRRKSAAWSSDQTTMSVS